MCEGVLLKKIPLGHGRFAKVDDADYDHLMQWKWQGKKASCNYYASRNSSTNGRKHTVFMSRYLMQCPDDMEVDHKDGDSLNNQRENLEIVTKQQNLARMWAVRRAKTEDDIPI